MSPLTTLSTHPDVLERLVSLCKRRGFIFQSSEIYGGTGSVWDYGPLGVELKRNLKDRWWYSMVRARDDIEGIDAAILMHREVWVASGHVAGFTDPLVDCRNCKKRFRADDPRIKGTPGTPDAQCPGKHVFELAVFRHDGDWKEAEVWKQAHQFNVSLRAAQCPPLPEPYPLPRCSHRPPPYNRPP